MPNSSAHVELASYGPRKGLGLNAGIIHRMDTDNFRDRYGCWWPRRTFLPQTTLQLAFGVKSTDGVTVFFVRHWGALLFVVCALTVYSAYVRLPACQS